MGFWAAGLLAALAVARPSRAEDKDAAAPRIRVEPEAFDFGKALPGKTLRKEFTLRNFGDAELVIEGVTTTCGCTAAISAKTRLEAGGSTQLTRHARDAQLLRQAGAAGAGAVERPQDAAADGAGERDRGEAGREPAN